MMIIAICLGLMSSTDPDMNWRTAYFVHGFIAFNAGDIKYWRHFAENPNEDYFLVFNGGMDKALVSLVSTGRIGSCHAIPQHADLTIDVAIQPQCRFTNLNDR